MNKLLLLLFCCLWQPEAAPPTDAASFAARTARVVDADALAFLNPFQFYNR